MLCFNPSNYQTMLHGLCLNSFWGNGFSEQAGLRCRYDKTPERQCKSLKRKTPQNGAFLCSLIKGDQLIAYKL
jgi:hypothetical protein